MADLVEHLAELERRDRVADTGCPDLYAYCLRVLGYSQAAAFARVRAARAAILCPRIAQSVRSYLEKLRPRPKRARMPRNGGYKRRRVPAAVRRLVWERDEGRCVFMSEDGVRCGSRDFIQIDHIVPWARGGASDDPGNLRLLCRPHNLRLARKCFGAKVPRRSQLSANTVVNAPLPGGPAASRPPGSGRPARSDEAPQSAPRIPLSDPPGAPPP